MIRVAVARPCGRRLQIGGCCVLGGVAEEMDVRDDRALLAASRAQGRGFETFYRRHYAAVAAFHLGRCGDRELAADLTAETFAAALVAVHDAGRALPEVPLAWLFAIARRKLIDARRRGRARDEARRRLAFERLVLDEEDIARVGQVAREVDVVGYLAARLPKDQFVALRARVLDEREYAEIARDLRVSPAVVRMRVSRALKTLRARAGNGIGGSR